MTLPESLLNGAGSINDELIKNMPNDAVGADRFYNTFSYPQPQNPYHPYDYSGNYYAAQPAYGIINNGYGLKLGVSQGPAIYGDHVPAAYSNGGYLGHATYDHNIYAGHGGGGGGHGGGGGSGHQQHRSKNSSAAMNALTLLAFLFFINILQTCLKEQMASMNPTVMVMTAGTGRHQTKTIDNNANKALDDYEVYTGETMITIPPEDNANDELLTNDEGDVFYQPQHTISAKLGNSFEARHLNETLTAAVNVN